MSSPIEGGDRRPLSTFSPSDIAGWFPRHIFPGRFNHLDRFKMIEFAKRTVLAGGLAAAALLAMVTLAAAADAPYSISVENGTAKVGETARIKVTITAAEGWRADFRYPHKIENLSAAGGAELAFKSVRASSAAGRSIVFVVSVKATEFGVHKVTGDILFSVSDGKKKLTEKVPLAATVTGEKAGS